MHIRRYRIRRGGVAVLFAGFLLGHAHAAHAQRDSGIQLTPDSARYLISKDVGPDRWAISYNLADKTVTGNVLVNGTTPQFIACTVTSVDQAPNPADAQYHLRCQFAQKCDSAPCVGQWGDAFDVPPIPGSFFLPANTLATLSGNVQPIYNASCATSAVCHGNGAQFVVLAAGVSWHNTFGVESNGPNGMQGPIISPFQPDASFLYKKLDGTGAGERMPYNGSALPAEQTEAVRNWILEGAADN